MKDAVATMGGILPHDAGGRDAVHVAVISAVAREPLAPGQPVGFSREKVDGEGYAVSKPEKLIGIVDPFIPRGVAEGQRFWIYIYPRMITGLNHRWSHPDLPDEGVKGGGIYKPPAHKLASEQWLKDFLRGGGFPSYDLIIKAVMSPDGSAYDGDDNYYGVSIEDGYITSHGADANGDIPDEFWDHIEIVTGKKITKRPEYFSCSC